MGSDEDEALSIDGREPDIDDEGSMGYLSIRKRVDRALEKDDKDEFVQLVNSLPCLEDGLDWIQCFMWYWDSANCAAAVLAGETQISDFNACVPTSVSSSPLHYAAENRAYNITTLLLKSGFSANTRCDYHYAPLNLRNVSPLDVALSKLRLLLSKGYVTGRTSAVKLIIEFFRQPVQRFGIMGLLAQNSKEAKHDFFNYLKDGKMVEVGALLLAARPQLLSHSTSQGFRSISEMHDFLLDVKTSLFVGASVADENKLIEMEETLLLLKIFDRIGDKLETLLRFNCFPGNPSMSAASVIEDAGFRVKAEYVYQDNVMLRLKTAKFLSNHSNVLGSSVDHCNKTPFTTYLLPSWLKGELNVLADKSGSSTPPFKSEAPVEMNVSMLGNVPLNRLLKRTAPVLGALKRVYKRG